MTLLWQKITDILSQTPPCFSWATMILMESWYPLTCQSTEFRVKPHSYLSFIYWNSDMLKENQWRPVLFFSRGPGIRKNGTGHSQPNIQCRNFPPRSGPTFSCTAFLSRKVWLSFGSVETNASILLFIFLLPQLHLRKPKLLLTVNHSASFLRNICLLKPYS